MPYLGRYSARRNETVRAAGPLRLSSADQALVTFQRERSQPIGSGHCIEYGRPVECQLSDPAYWPMYAAFGCNVRSQQYLDDYRIAFAVQSSDRIVERGACHYARPGMHRARFAKARFSGKRDRVHSAFHSKRALRFVLLST